MLSSIILLFNYILNNLLLRLVFNIAAGTLLALSLPQFGFWWAAWFSLTALILLIKSSESYFLTIIESLIFFMVFNLIAFSWASSILPLDWIGVSGWQAWIIAKLAAITPSLSHSLLMTVFFSTLVFFFYQIKDPKHSYNLSLVEIMILAFIWIIVEFKLICAPGLFIKSFAVPSNFIVYGQTKFPAFMQIADHIGAAGLEWLIVAVNLGLSVFVSYDKELIRHSALRKNRAFKLYELKDLANMSKMILFFALVFTGIYFYSEHKIDDYLISEARKVKQEVTLIQANLNPRDTRSKVNKQNFDKQLNLSLVNTYYSVTDKPKPILIWAEGSVPTFKRGRSYYEFLSYAPEHYAGFLYGSYDREGIDDFNAIKGLNFTLDNEKQDIVYRKRVLVPFGEYTPFINYLPSSLNKLATTTIGTGFQAGDDDNASIDISYAKFMPSICFELLLPDLFKKTTGNCMLNISDLSWFSNPAIYKIFKAIARFRAVEQNKYLVVTANSGPSMLINPLGEVLLQSDFQEVKRLNGTISLSAKDSFYKKFTW
jgi:apolipoprotein N-acyltransferase